MLSEAEEVEADWGSIHDPLQKEAQSAIVQEIRNLRLNTKRQECPDIGQTIESYVKSAGARADSWCRTGVLTFDNNLKVQKKPMFSRIKESSATFPLFKWILHT